MMNDNGAENSGYRYYKKWQQRRQELTERVKDQINDSPGARIIRAPETTRATLTGRKYSGLKQQIEEFAGTQKGAKSVNQSRHYDSAVTSFPFQSRAKDKADKPGKSRFDDVLNNYFSAFQLSSEPSIASGFAPAHSKEVKGESKIKRLIGEMQSAFSLRNSPERRPSPEKVKKSPILSFKEQLGLEKQRVTGDGTSSRKTIEFPLSTKASIFPLRRATGNAVKPDTTKNDLADAFSSATMTIPQSARDYCFENAVPKITKTNIKGFQQKLDSMTAEEWAELPLTCQTMLKELANTILTKLKPTNKAVKSAFNNY